MAKVLVVDDEPNICALLSATLRLTGFEVRVAERWPGGARRRGPSSSRTWWCST